MYCRCSTHVLQDVALLPYNIMIDFLWNNALKCVYLTDLYTWPVYTYYKADLPKSHFEQLYYISVMGTACEQMLCLGHGRQQYFRSFINKDKDKALFYIGFKNNKH